MTDIQGTTANEPRDLAAVLDLASMHVRMALENWEVASALAARGDELDQQQDIALFFRCAYFALRDQGVLHLTRALEPKLKPRQASVYQAIQMLEAEPTTQTHLAQPQHALSPIGLDPSSEAPPELVSKAFVAWARGKLESASFQGAYEAVRQLRDKVISHHDLDARVAREALHGFKTAADIAAEIVRQALTLYKGLSPVHDPHRVIAAELGKQTLTVLRQCTRPIPRRRPWSMLKAGLFDASNRAPRFALFAEGIRHCSANSRRCLDSAEVLNRDGKSAVAFFVLATAAEEAGKALVLIELLRVDPRTREGVINKLCKGFYSHDLKYAVARTAIRRPSSAAQAWDHLNVLQENEGFEPGDYSLPTEQSQNREWSLYVDLDTTFAPVDAARWHEPKDEIRAEMLRMDIGSYGLSFDGLRGFLDLLGRACDSGGLSDRNLQTFHELSVREPFDQDTSDADFLHWADRVTAAIGAGRLFPPLIPWPWYLAL